MTNLKTKRKVLARSDAEPYLEPYKAILQKTLEEAWDWVQVILDEKKDRRKVIDISIQAAMVYVRFVEQLHKKLFVDPNVRIRKHGRMVTFIIAQKLRLRFKKFDRNLRSGNVKTILQQALNHQFELPGLDNDVTDVKFGYSTDIPARNITGVYITCPKDWKDNAWFIYLGDEKADALPFVVAPPELPLPATKIKKPKEDRG